MNYYTNRISFDFAKLLRRIPINNDIKKAFNKKRHNAINNFLYPIFNEAEAMPKSANKTSKNDNVWVFWWQGKDNMPEIVKYCFDSISRNYCSKKIILVTKDNFKKYTDISKNIIVLLKKGKITLTHFSDILRFNLLKNHGGLWIDATVFVSSKIDPMSFNTFFTCSGYQDDDAFFVTNGNWCGFLIGGDVNNELFSFMNNFFELYWRFHNKQVDYFLIDYALNYAWKKNIGNFKNYTSYYEGKKNPNLFVLQGILNEKFQKGKWEKIDFNTNMYKLSYKKRIKEDKGTYYDVIVKGKDK